MLTVHDVARLLHSGARVHITVTAEDGSDVVDTDARVSAFDNRRGKPRLCVVTSDGREMWVPVEVAAMVRPAVAGGVR